MLLIDALVSYDRIYDHMFANTIMIVLAITVAIRVCAEIDPSVGHEIQETGRKDSQGHGCSALDGSGPTGCT